MNINDIVIFSTEDSHYFAELIAKGIGVSVTETERRIFSGGEKYFRLGIDTNEDLIGKTAIVVASTHSDECITELIRVASGLKGCGTERRIFVIPFFGYSTMERATNPGEIVTAKVIARQLSQLPGAHANTFYLFDTHTPGLIHYFEGDCARHELHAMDEMTEVIKRLTLIDYMFASADLGRPAIVAEFSKRFGTRIALINKEREFEETKVLDVIGNVKGKHVIIYDDMTRSAKTQIDAAEAYIEGGAQEVSVVLSHFALNNISIVNHIYKNSPIRRIITTNSHPMSHEVSLRWHDDVGNEAFKMIKIIDISPIFVRAIKKQLRIAD